MASTVAVQERVGFETSAGLMKQRPVASSVRLNAT
jgi:hypothetical protein